jgi:hypothetical protein
LQATGDTLGFGERAGQFAANLGLQGAGASQNLAGLLAQLRQNSLGFGERAQQSREALARDLLASIERRTDQGPTYDQLVQLAMLIGAGGYGWGSVPPLPAPGGRQVSALPQPGTSWYPRPSTASPQAIPPAYPMNIQPYYYG